jgi:hypothetical protein
MKHMRIRTVVIIVLALGRFGAGAGWAKGPGVSDTVVTVGTSAGLTGPIAMWGNRMARIGPQA